MTTPLNVIYGLSLDGVSIRYVGMTAAGVEARLFGHRQGVRKGRMQPVYCWMRKHGAGNVVGTVLEECDRDQLKEREIYWIEHLQTHISCGKGGLNCTRGGDGNWGWVPNAETLKRMSLASTGRICSSETRAKMSAASKGRPGKTPNAETRAKIGAAGRGRKKSPETIAKQSAAMTGRIRTPEHCASISRAQTGKVRSSETRANMSKAHLGKPGHPVSVETRVKLSAFWTGKPNLGAHMRWHANRGIVREGCQFCADAAYAMTEPREAGTSM